MSHSKSVFLIQILELLGEDSTTTIADLPAELDIQIESAVRHCMAVAHIANQHHRDLLVRNAQKVSLMAHFHWPKSKYS